MKKQSKKISILVSTVLIGFVVLLKVEHAAASELASVSDHEGFSMLTWFFISLVLAAFGYKIKA